MSLENRLKPVNKNHSIKEAVIGVFLATPILKPERFRDLIESEFSTKFQLFEPIAQFRFQIKGQGNVPISPTSEFLNNAGFKFTSYDKGKVEKVLQGINEEGRTVVSYHALNYVNWSSFYDDCVECLAIIAKKQSDLFINAFSLLYVDEFSWTDTHPFDISLVFNKDSSFLPRQFFSSSKTDYNLVSEKKIDQNTQYYDRTQIRVEPSLLNQTTIVISHNATQPLADVQKLDDLIVSENFKKMLTVAHRHNKDFLNDVLVDEVIKMIKL
jgi:uncharacterized protein (TIGR04255 family)